MALSIKQKQILGVTSIVALVVVVLSVLQLSALARVLLQQSQERAEVLANTIYHRATEVVTFQETAYDELRRAQAVHATLETAIYSENVTYAAIVDHTGIVVAHNDRARIGERLPEAGDLAAVLHADRLTQLRAIYSTRRARSNGDSRCSSTKCRSPRSASACRRFSSATSSTTGSVPRRSPRSSRSSARMVVAVLLAQIVVRPIHVIRSGLTRLGQGDLGATLDLKGDEFKELGDVFASVSNQLQRDASRRRAALAAARAVAARHRARPVDGRRGARSQESAQCDDHSSRAAQSQDGGRTGAQGTNDHLEVIGREIRRLDDVVQGFLKFARPEELTLQPVAPSALMGDVLEMIEPEARAAGVTLERDCPPQVPRDRGRRHNSASGARQSGEERDSSDAGRRTAARVVQGVDRTAASRSV